MAASKSRAWCFTWFHGGREEANSYADCGADYVVVGRELCPSTGRPHHQGYARWPNAIGLKRAKDLLPLGCHLEAARGSPAQNREYCVKGGDIYVEVGECPRQGKRSDLDAVRELVRGTGRMEQVVMRAASYQAMRAGELVLRYCEPQRNERPAVAWLWGPAGCGKTRKAFSEAVAPWVSGASLRWWDGYDGHAHVILDDFRHDHCSFVTLLRVLDRYPYRVEVKGGSRQLLATHIWITCPRTPESEYAGRAGGEDLQQLLRRIDRIEYCGGLPPPVLPFGEAAGTEVEGSTAASSRRDDGSVAASTEKGEASEYDDLAEWLSG